MTRHVLDASAALAHLLDEAGGDRVVPHLKDGLLSAVNLSEVATRLIRTGRNPIRADYLGCTVVDHDADLAHRTARLWPLTAHLGLSPGDRACLALGQVAAEYILRWVPAGTHDWNQFLKPEEIRLMLSEEPVAVSGPYGLVYDPLADRWSESDDAGINYMMIATRD